MRILRTTYSDMPSIVECQGQKVEVRSTQIIVWVSLKVGHVFPAILDTGHSHNFSINEQQLREWAGLRVEDMEMMGHLWVLKQRVPVVRSNFWLHGKEPYQLEMKDGITVMPGSLAPRLPLLGLLAITRNETRLVVDGKRREVTLKKGWF